MLVVIVYIILRGDNIITMGSLHRFVIDCLERIVTPVRSPDMVINVHHGSKSKLTWLIPYLTK